MRKLLTLLVQLVPLILERVLNRPKPSVVIAPKKQRMQIVNSYLRHRLRQRRERREG